MADHVPQPEFSADRKYVQVQFLDNQMLLLPVNAEQASRAVAAWENGSPKISLYPNDGTAFHVTATQVRYVRMVTEPVAAKMIEESNANAKRMNEQQQMQIEAARAQRDETLKQIQHNDEMRELQKTQMAKSGVIRAV
jgi:hypothetical protein